ARREDPRDACGALDVRVDPAHDVVLAGPDWDRFVDGIDSRILLRELPHHRELLADHVLAEVPEVEVDVLPVRPLKPAALADLLDDRAREDVPGPELHLLGDVFLQEPLALAVDQVPALA